MKANHSKLWLTLSLLLAMGCGARTPLDDWETTQPASPGAGGATSRSGGASGTSASLGGSLATGGQGDGDSRGGQVATGGTGGPFATGGRGGSGGTPPPRGTLAGGHADGGQVATGGRGGQVPFGVGGTVVGGRGGSGGTPPRGGTVVGGRTARTGGNIPDGGIIVGGRGGSGGTPPRGGTAVGGRGGSAGSGAVGGTGAAGNGGTSGTTSCPLSFSLGETPIDDMDDGDRLIEQVDGRSGAWSDSHGGTAGPTMFPDPAGPFTMTATGDGCPGYSAYVHGGPFVDGMALFLFGLGSPYNASAYTGFSFWAKIDSGTSPGLRVAFPDKDTQPEGALCQWSAALNTCFDHYGIRMTLNTTWTKHSIDFSSLAQDGWGHLGAAFDPSTIYEVQFQIPINATFGIWIDDVAFTSNYHVP
jgi:hypothetical protein